MKTYSPKPEHIQRHWYVLDASEQVLGRLASEAAVLLRGKHKPIFAPHVDTGDHVIIVNADKVRLTGGKEMKKFAYHHSGYPGGIKGTRYDTLLATRPVFAVEKAIRGMLPKNSLGRAMAKKLHVVAGPEHPHAGQRPVPIAVGERPAWQGFPVKEAPAPAAEKPAAKAKTAKDEPAAEKAKPAAAKPKATSAKPKPTSAKAKATSAKSRTAKPKATKAAAASATKTKAAAASATKKTSARKPATKKPAEEE